MKQYFEQISKDIWDSLCSMDDVRFDELVADAVETLEAGHKIIVSGLGKNVPVCDKFVGTMLSMGQRASYMNTNSATHGDLGMVEKGDLVIILTKSGETSESIYLHSLLCQRECKRWLLTFNRESTLGREVDHVLALELSDEGDPWNIAPNNSTTVNLIVLQGLAMEIVRRRGFTLEEFKKNHPGGHIGAVLNHEKE